MGRPATRYLGAKFHSDTFSRSGVSWVIDVHSPYIIHFEYLIIVRQRPKDKRIKTYWYRVHISVLVYNTAL